MQRRYLRRQVNFDQFKSARRRRRIKFLIWGLALFLLLGGATYVVFQTGILQTVSFVARLINPVKLKEEEGRVNVLVLGVDTRGTSGLMNTDTILMGSVSTLEGNPVLVSIPRDFWVNMGTYGAGRINAAYSRGGTEPNGQFNEDKGIAFAKTKVEEILGIKIPYFALVDFSGFVRIVDTLGGIEVCVEKEFYDYSYPVAGREAAYPVSSRYEVLHFKAGCQNMDGKTALKFARSRSGNNGEGNDFSRVRRQQKVILGVKNKVFTLDILLNPVKLGQIFDQVTKTVKTNVSFGELQRGLEIAAELGDLSQVKSLVLDPESGLVYHPTNAAPYGGAYVLIPKSAGYAKIQEALRKLFFVPPAQEASGTKN